MTSGSAVAGFAFRFGAAGYLELRSSHRVRGLPLVTGHWPMVIPRSGPAIPPLLCAPVKRKIYEKEKDRAGERYAVAAVVPPAGLEPARPYGQRILSPQRLPFRHEGGHTRARLS